MQIHIEIRADTKHLAWRGPSVTLTPGAQRRRNVICKVDFKVEFQDKLEVDEKISSSMDYPHHLPPDIQGFPQL